jgi:microcystin-dependent protein
VTKMRDLNYNDRLPEMVLDSLMEFISTLLVNFRITIVGNTTLRVAAGTVNDQVGAGVMGRWRYVTANVDAAHPGGAAGPYDVWLTASDNAVAVSGNPPGQSPENDNTVYAFAMGITASGAGAPAGPALSRRVATCQWDGTKITRVTPLAGNMPVNISDVVVVSPETATRNLVQPSGDWLPLILRRFSAAAVADLLSVQDDAGATLYKVTRDGIPVPPTIPTATRDALPVGRRPVGGIFFNSTTSQMETNIGTDAAPIWTGLGGYGPGIALDFLGDERDAPPRTTTADGHQLAKAAEPGLWNKLSRGGTVASPWDTFGGLPAPSAGNYRVPDLRGRATIGKKDMGALLGTAPPTITGAAITRAAAATLGALFGEEFHTLLTAEMPSHSHTGVTGPQSATHTHTGTTDTENTGHFHTVGSHAHGGGNHLHQMSGDAFGLQPGGNTYIAISNTPIANTTQYSGNTIGAEAPGTTISDRLHTHTFTSAVGSVGHTHSIAAEGGGGAHENVFPVAVVNKIVTL